MMFRSIMVLGLTLSASAGERHWAYEAPVAAEVPGGGNPVDAFLKAGREEAGLKPAPLADPARWLERAAFTLTGLPPSEDQRRRMAEGRDEATWHALIDELLASPAYGERWARYWMDVARYADTQGYNFDRDNRYPYAYTYRDWLIRAFNEDLPYDRFVKMQIAADLMVDQPDDPQVAALGMLTVGPRGGGVEMIDDRVDVITRGFMSTTVSCARCHDHKTDPITQQDYYSFYSILENTHEEQPVIGVPADQAAFASFQEKKRALEDQDQAVRQGIVDQMRSRDVLANYLELAWRAKTENWDMAPATAEGFKKGRYRPTAILRWRDFLNETAWGEAALPRLAEWVAAMEGAEDRMAPCHALAEEWIARLAAGGELAELAKRDTCPLSYDAARITDIFDVQDGNEQRERQSAMARLEMEDAGAPPRAMSLRDRENPGPAQVFKRGNPGDRGEPFEKHWLSALGGEVYPAGASARLAMAEKIASRSNPLTARVMVNRVWAWNFGTPLADPGDFGPQQPEPPERELLDWLAVWFMDHDWSVKQLNRLLLGSEAFRLAAEGPAENDRIDQANTRYWKWNRRRMDFEAMRDRLLATGGVLAEGPIGGRSVNLLSADSDHRRSVYGFVDRYALPGLFVSFDLPHPDHHAPKRLETTVPQQALYFLNNALPIRLAARLAEEAEFKTLDDEAKVAWLYQRIYQRKPAPQETADLLEWLRGVSAEDHAPLLGGHWEVRHAADGGELVSFPMLDDGVWKTGKDLASAPVRWLNAGPAGGHAAAGHALVLRWRAEGAGEVFMKGSISRPQKGGSTLVWEVAGPDGNPVAGAPFAPESSAEIESSWMTVAAGDTVDFVLRAPEGDACGSTNWTLKILGRETSDGAVAEVGDFGKQFPQTDEIPPPRSSGNPWADLAQMLWASNEFHFIE